MHMNWTQNVEITSWNIIDVSNKNERPKAANTFYTAIVKGDITISD